MSANDKNKIIMTTCEGRPCWVKGRRAIFHRWTDSARPVSPYGKDNPSDERLQKWSVHAIVEYEDGIVEREWPNSIQFADSAEKFAAFDWEAMEDRRDALPYDLAPDPDEGEQTKTLSIDEAEAILKRCESCRHKGRLFDTSCLYCLGGYRYEPKEGVNG